MEINYISRMHGVLKSMYADMVVDSIVTLQGFLIPICNLAILQYLCLTLTIPTGIAFSAALLVHQRGLAAFGA